MNTPVRFVKSFSKGQITIPKEFRDLFGIGDEFWLKMSVDHGKFIMEPVEKEKKISKEEWRKWVLNFKGTWDLRDEIKEVREEMEKKIKAREL